MNPDAASSVESLEWQRQLDEVCARFEAAWKAGSPPRLDDFLNAAPASDRRELLHELLTLDEYYRRKSGGAASDADYIAQLPSDAETIREYFAGRANTAPKKAGLPTVPGYTIERELGRGGMGVVYLAQQDRPRRRVVLKMIHEGARTHLAALRRFQTESEAIARLQHPNIVHVYSVGEHEGRPYMALEYVDGGGLDRQLDGQPIVPHDAAILIEVLARTVHYAHQQGVIHRDLKPANILLQKDDGGRMKEESEQKCFGASFILSSSSFVPKIADFGLAKLLEGDSGSLTMTGETLGTPSYMAPEQARGNTAEIGPATDVFALGIILYQLLTGRPPFLGPNAVATLEQVTGVDPVSPRQLQPRVPPDLNTICLKCLEKAPRQRYASAGDLADDLRRFQAGAPIHARAVSLPERAVRWSRRYPSAAGLIATLCVGLTVMTGLVLRLELAQRNERLAKQRAREAVEQALVFLSEDEEMVHRGLYELRGRVLQAAIRLVEPIQAQANDSDLTYKLARANYELGHVQEPRGRFPEALAATNQAVALLQQLTSLPSREFRHALDLAQCLNQRGKLYGLSLQLDQAHQELTQAEAMIRELLVQQPDHPAIRMALAENFLHRAVFNTHGVVFANKTRSLDLLLRAWDEVDASLKAAPGDVRNLRTAAAVWQRCATMTRLHAELTAGELELHRAAVARLQGVAEAQPTDCQIQVEMGITYFNLADGDWREDRFQEAENHARQAVTVFERLTNDAPKVLTYRWRLAMSYANLAETMESQSRIPEAQVAYQRTSQIIEAEFLRKTNDQSSRDIALAITLLQGYVDFLIRRGDLDRAGQFIDRAELIAMPAAKDLASYESLRAKSLMARATIKDLRGRYQESLAAWEQADAIGRVYWENRLRVGRCLALAGLGEIENAAAAAKLVIDAKDLERDQLFHLARAFARCSRHSPTDARKAQFAQSAVECLEKAHRLGYFRAADHVATLQSNGDLAPLRDHADFAALVQAVNVAQTKP